MSSDVTAATPPPGSGTRAADPSSPADRPQPGHTAQPSVPSGSLAPTQAAELGRVLVGLARVLSAQQVVDWAVDRVPGAQFAAITTTDDGNEGQGAPRTIASTHVIAAAVDQAQAVHGQGPSLQAVCDTAVVHCQDLISESRWPRFTRAVVIDCPVVRSVLAFPLVLPGPQVAALTVSSPDPGAFRAAFAAAPTGWLTDHLADLSIEQLEQNRHLRTALVSNRRIGAAVGILMARELLTEAQAFDRLRVASSHRNCKLVDVAGEVILTGLLSPGRPGPAAQRRHRPADAGAAAGATAPAPTGHSRQQGTHPGTAAAPAGQGPVNP